jgi:hypothetical protein
MDIFTAAQIAEGIEQPESEEQYLEAWQFLVDEGIALQLQGWFGRTAAALIENGFINPPRKH